MRSSVCLLRGINVGGHNKLPMASLRKIGEELGLTNVSTHINSGNLVFSNEPGPNLADRLAEQILIQHGISIPVVVCSSERLHKALECNPFPEADPKRVLVYFCSAEPTAEAVQALDLGRSPGDKLEVIGGEVFIWTPGGSRETKFTLGYLEKTLGVTMTSRNINTLAKLCGLTR